MVTPVRAPPSDAGQRVRDAVDALRELEHRRDVDHRDLQELRDLLSRPHFKVRVFFLNVHTVIDIIYVNKYVFH